MYLKERKLELPVREYVHHSLTDHVDEQNHSETERDLNRPRRHIVHWAHEVIIPAEEIGYKALLIFRSEHYKQMSNG